MGTCQDGSLQISMGFMLYATYSVWMDFKYSNVPLANDCKLLSYSDNKLRLCKSRNASRRMHSISLAFSSSSCSEASPLNTPLGRSLILLPYNTLEEMEQREIGGQ